MAGIGRDIRWQVPRWLSVLLEKDGIFSSSVLQQEGIELSFGDQDLDADARMRD